ncbi:MAG: phenylacetaldehyde dehydrogenase [Halieaceae bacterium]|jgi:phenylacetaldehyde dehydrogenase
MNTDQLPEAISQFLAREHTMLVGGRWEGTGDSRIDVINPATGQCISTIANASRSDVDAAVTAARAGLESPAWRSMAPAERAALLRKAADLVEANAEELAYLETLDNGKPLSISQSVDVMASVGALRYFAGWADKIHGTTHNVNMPGDHHAFTLREPIGVAALIVPWNYPLVMAAMKLGPALAAGCACILKPAEDTSLSAIRLCEILVEAGFPAGVINLVTGLGHQAGAALAEHPGVDKIAFTGSTATGKLIVKAAAGNLKKVTLELGGKSPNIILADAELEKAIPAAAMAVFFNSGQTCTAATRLYVQDAVYDQVIAGIVEVAKNLKVSHGFDPEAVLGPLISARQLERVRGYVQKGRDEGGEIVYGGEQIGEEGYFFQPTVIGNTRNDMAVVREEIFGPVIAAQSFSTVDEVIALANDSEYGLSSSVWTQNISHGHRIARELVTGQVGINTAMVADWDLPIGGYKQSGWGRENGFDAVANYLQTKAVAVAL